MDLYKQSLRAANNPSVLISRCEMRSSCHGSTVAIPGCERREEEEKKTREKNNNSFDFCPSDLPFHVDKCVCVCEFPLQSRITLTSREKKTMK